MSKSHAFGSDRVLLPDPDRHAAHMTQPHPGSHQAAEPATGEQGLMVCDHDDPDAGVGPPFPDHFGPIVRAALAGQRRWDVEPEDASQEAWLKLLADLAAGRACEQSPARLVVMIRHHLADLGRRAARRRSRGLSPDLVGALISREDDPAEACERGQARLVVQEALAEARSRISALSHRVIVLRWVDGLTFEEIAEKLGTPVTRVRDRHRRALLVVRSLLARRLDFHRAEPAGATPGGGPEAQVSREVTR